VPAAYKDELGVLVVRPGKNINQIWGKK